MVSPLSVFRKSVRALVIDNDSEARDLICKALTVKGFDVCACASLSQGREFFNKQSIVLARSPGRGIGGLEFTSFVDWVRERAEGSQPYIVAIDDQAGENEDAMMTAAANPGCNAVMATPMDDRAMDARLDSIDRWLDSCGHQGVSRGEVVALNRSRIDSPFEKVPNGRALPLDGEMAYSDVLVEHVPLAMAMFDTKMCYLVANHKWKAEFHLEEVELPGRCHYDVFPTLPQSWRRLLERCIAKGVSERCEEDRFLRPDGSSDWARWEVGPWYQANGIVGGLIITSEIITEQKLREDRLQFEKSFASSLLEHAEAPVMTVDLDGRVQQRNPASELLMGASLSEEGEPFYWDVLGPAVETAPEKDRFVKSVRVLRESGRLKAAPGFVCRLKEETGKDRQNSIPRRQFAWSMIPHVSEGEAIDEFILIGTEIDPGESKKEVPVATVPTPLSAGGGGMSSDVGRRREEELLEERNRIATVPENLPVGIVLLDREGRVVYSNPQHVAVLGFDASESADVESWLRRGCPGGDCAQKVIGAWRENVWRKQVPKVLSLVTSEGLLKDVRFESKLLEDGNLLVSFSDVTEGRRLEEALHASEAKCRAFFQGSSVGMALVDRGGEFIDINTALEEMLGYPRWELRSKPLSAFICTEDLAGLEAIDSVNAGGDARIQEVEVRLIRKNKRMVWVRLTASPVRDQDGNLLFMAYTVCDIEEQLRAKRDGNRRRLLEIAGVKVESHLMTV